MPPPLHCEWSLPLLSGTASESDPLLFFFLLKLGLLVSFHEHFLCIFAFSWLLGFCSLGGSDTFSENVMIFEPIFSLCVTIFPDKGGCGSSNGLSNWRKVSGGGDSVGGLSRLRLCGKRAYQIRRFIGCRSIQISLVEGKLFKV